MMKSSKGPGSSGGRGPLRQWASSSYDPIDSRSHVSNDHAQPNRQLPSGFEARDRRCTQGRTPVRDRGYTDKYDG
jgi:hypothetical protein